MANKKATEAKRQVKAAYVKELTRLDKQHGGVKASTVVAEAEPKESPLHPWFEWDNKKAGHAHRLMQARTLIRVVVPQLEGAISPAPDPYVHVPAEKAEDGKEGTYHRMSVVVESVDLFSRALAELATKVRAAVAAADELRQAAAAQDNPDAERMARIAMAITALQTAGAAVSALH